MIKILSVILFLITLPLVYQTDADAYKWQRSVEEGISYIHLKQKTYNSPLHIHVLIIDLKNNKIGIRPVLASGKLGTLEKTSDIALKSNAIAAINGSFFITKNDLNLPVGDLIINKKLLSKSILNRTAVGFTDDKQIIFGMPKVKGYAINLRSRKSVTIWGINRPRKLNETVIYTDEFGGNTKTNQWGKEIIVDSNNKVVKKGRGNSEILKDGFVVSLHGWSRDFYDNIKIGDKIELKYNLINGWQNVTHAITGGPLLIENGEIVVDESLKNEKFHKYLLSPNSRTAIGVINNNKLILAVIDKRHGISSGTTYKELANILKECGADYAMGLDGGSTSTMYLSGQIVNYPLNTRERRVSNAIIITYNGWNLSKAFMDGALFSSGTSRLTENAFLEIIKDNSALTPSSYFQQPEDYGLYGLNQIYEKVIKPVTPDLFKKVDL